MTESDHLLQRYVREHSEEAFGQLVDQYVWLVFSTALRRTNGDVHLAQDVAQNVFIALAQKAPSLTKIPSLGGWLHRHTCFVASTLIRTERRRQNREKQAVEMNQTHADPIWKQLAPVLDDAIDRLGTTDRLAIVLRFYERRQLHLVGHALGLSEDAAGKRVGRALEKLRRFLVKQGVVLTPAALASALATEVVCAAPMGLAPSLSAAAITTASAATSATILQLMAISKIKIVATVTLLACIVAAPVVIQQQRKLQRVQEESAALRRQLAEMDRLRVAADQRPARQPDQDQLAQAQKEHRELLRLRGEVGLLRKESQELARLRSQKLPVEATPEDRHAYRPADSWANVGTDSPEAALETFFWAAKKKETDLVGKLIRWRKDDSFPDLEGLDQLMEPLVPASARFVSDLAGIRVVAQKDEDTSTRRVRVEFTSTAGKTEPKEVQFVQEDGQWMPLFHAWSPHEGSIQAAFEVPLSPDLAPVN